MNELLAGIGYRSSSARKLKNDTVGFRIRPFPLQSLGKKLCGRRTLLRSVRHCRFQRITC